MYARTRVCVNFCFQRFFYFVLCSPFFSFFFRYTFLLVFFFIGSLTMHFAFFFFRLSFFRFEVGVQLLFIN